MKISLSGSNRVILQYPEDNPHTPGQYVALSAEGYPYATKKLLDAKDFTTIGDAQRYANILKRRHTLKVCKLSIMVEIEEVE